MKPLVILILAFLVSIPFCKSFAQQRNIFLEVGGSGGLGSVNFEKPLWIPSAYNDSDNGSGKSATHSSYLFTWRAGFSLAPVDQHNGVALIFPVMVNWIYGFGKHKLEVGGGFAPTFTTNIAFYIKSPLVLGYRFEPNDKRWFTRISYTPIIGWLVDWQWQHWAGFSIGYKLQSK